MPVGNSSNFIGQCDKPWIANVTFASGLNRLDVIFLQFVARIMKDSSGRVNASNCEIVEQFQDYVSALKTQEEKRITYKGSITKVWTFRVFVSPISKLFPYMNQFQPMMMLFSGFVEKEDPFRCHFANDGDCYKGESIQCNVIPGCVHLRPCWEYSSNWKMCIRSRSNGCHLDCG